MEDKSPLYPGGEEFRIPDADNDDAETSKKDEKKQKKSKLSELWNKLFNKEVDEKDEGEKSLLQSIGALFGKATGLEKEEVQEEQGEEVEPEQQLEPGRELAVPILGGDIEYSPSYSIDDEQYTTAVDVPLTNTQSEYTIPLTPEQALSVDDELPSPQLYDTEPTAVGDTETVYSTEPEEVVSTANESTDSSEEPDLTTPEELARIRQEIADERGYEERPTDPVIKERETVIENRGGGGAAMLGFVAAEVLSRSRDKKIRKEADKLRHKVEALDKTQDVTNTERLEAEARNRQQIEELKNKRHGKVEQAFKVSEVKRAESTAVVDAAPVQPKQEVLRATEIDEQGSKSEATPSQESEVVFEQVRGAAERDIALEKYYEQRHELKDDPGGAQTHSGNRGKLTPNSQAHSPLLTPTVQYSLIAEEKQRQAQQTRDLYKHAITQGTIAGIIMLVSFAIVVFLWSLL